MTGLDVMAIYLTEVAEAMTYSFDQLCLCLLENNEQRRKNSVERTRRGHEECKVT